MNSNSEIVIHFSEGVASLPLCFWSLAYRKRLNIDGNISAIKVIVEPPTRSSNTPNSGIVSAAKIVAVIIAVRVKNLLSPNSINLQF